MYLDTCTGFRYMSSLVAGPPLLWENIGRPTRTCPRSNSSLGWTPFVAMAEWLMDGLPITVVVTRPAPATLSTHACIDVDMRQHCAISLFHFPSLPRCSSPGTGYTTTLELAYRPTSSTPNTMTPRSQAGHGCGAFSCPHINILLVPKLFVGRPPGLSRPIWTSRV